MKFNLNASSLSYSDFKYHLGNYPDYVPKKIQGLEELRLHEVPEILNQRRKEGNAFLEKTEVTGLVEWKLKHGTYRPNLAKLVTTNSIEDIRTTTRDAFATYEAHRDTDGHVKAITAMSTMKGVGPATASLFLSCYDPINVPFFSDELYRYLHWEDTRSKGWDRKINYTMKEYKELRNRCQTLRLRLERESKVGVKAIDIEKMAFALAKRAQQASSLGKHKEDGNIKELQPPSPKKRRKSTPPLSQAPMDVCRRKGPRGSPTYDEVRCELDYDFIMKCSGRPKPYSERGLQRLAEKQKEDERKRDIMEVGECGVIKLPTSALEDKVAKDLGLHFHEVGIEEFEQWHQKGFRRQKGELEDPSEEERKKLGRLETGSALRKGSKHR